LQQPTTFDRRVKLGIELAAHFGTIHRMIAYYGVNVLLKSTLA
jgi:hypothetical protein